MCEITPKRCEIACTGACNSVVDYTKHGSSCVAKPMKQEAETTLFTTEATQQKQHTTHNYSIYASLAISVHCCLHRCSHLTFIPPSCIGVRTFHFSIAVRCLEFVGHLSLEQLVRCLPC